MKWFQHDCDMHVDSKIKSLIQKHGAEGYAVWNLCLELLGRDGTRGKLDASFSWKGIIINTLYPRKKDDTKDHETELEAILSTLAELFLISPKYYKKGDLYVPKLLERADNWTKKLLRSNSEATPKHGKYTKAQIDTIREKFFELRQIPLTAVTKSEHMRCTKYIMELLDHTTGDVDIILQGMDWLSKKGWEPWSLGTLLKWWSEFMKQKEQYVPAASREVDLSHLRR